MQRCAKEYYDGLEFKEGANFEAVLRQRIALKRRDYGLFHPETREKRDEVIIEAQADAYRKGRDGE